jgi:hypothetical protein
MLLSGFTLYIFGKKTRLQVWMRCKPPLFQQIASPANGGITMLYMPWGFTVQTASKATPSTTELQSGVTPLLEERPGVRSQTTMEHSHCEAKPEKVSK